MNQVQIRNFEINKFSEFLFQLTAKGKDSLSRTRFIKLLMEQIDFLEKERMSMIERYAEKDENGQAVIEQLENGLSQYKIKQIEDFNLEYIDLMNQTFAIDCTPERRSMLEAVRDLVFNADLLLSGEKAMEYDRWYELLEVIRYEND